VGGNEVSSILVPHKDVDLDIVNRHV